MGGKESAGSPSPDLSWQAAVATPAGLALVVRLLRVAGRGALDDAGAVAVAAAWHEVVSWAATQRDQATADVADRFRARPVDVESTLPRRHAGEPPDPQVERIRRLRRVARSMRRAHAPLYALTQPPLPGEDDSNGDGSSMGVVEVEEAAVLADTIAVASAAGEVALAAGVSDYAAREWISTARTLASERLPHAAAAARAGRLDRAKTRDLVTATRELSPATAAAVDAAVVPHALMPDPAALAAGQLTAVGALRSTQAFRDAITAAIITIDPAGAAERAARRRRDRRVTIGPLDDTLARLEWLLPLERAAHVKALLDTGVRTAQTAYREARRAARDAARDAGEPFDPDHYPIPTADEIRDDVLYELITNDTVPGLREALINDTLTDTNRPTRPETTPPAPTEAAEPAAPAAPSPPSPSPSPPPPPPPPPLPPPPTASGADAEAEADADTTWSADADTAAAAAAAARRSPVQVIVHIPFDVLFGHAQHPGLIEGVGPITADLARSMAADADWRCAVTDPDHGTVLGLGRRTYTPAYTPTVGLRRLLAVSQHSCGKPGCRVRAQHCDVDHLVNHPAGATCSCNTELKCRRDHLLKTFAGWRTTPGTRPEDPPGTVIWTTPTGHRYLAPPTTLRAALHASSSHGGSDASAPEPPALHALRLWKAQLAAHHEHQARQLADLRERRQRHRPHRPPKDPTLDDDSPPF